MPKGTVCVNVPLLNEIMKFDNLRDEEIRERAGWSTPINLRRARERRPLLKRIFGELAGALSVNPVSLLFDGSGATYADVLRGREKDRSPPGLDFITVPNVIRGRATVRELHALDDDGRVGELPEDRRRYYKVEGATLTICGTEAKLILDKVTMYRDPRLSKKSSSNRLEGEGPFEHGVATILYTARDHDRKASWSWTGVCVLSVPQNPKNGKVHGYWMAKGHSAPGIVLGTLELVPTLAEPVAPTS